MGNLGLALYFYLFCRSAAWDVVVRISQVGKELQCVRVSIWNAKRVED